MKPGVYRAKVTKHGSNDACFVVIPQVFLDTEVTLADYIGTERPSVGSTGYVAYIAGDSAWPVWLGGADALFDSQQLDEAVANAQSTADDAQAAADAAQSSADATNIVANAAGVAALAADANADTRVLKAGDTMTGQLSLVGDPTADAHAARKKYVDDAVADLPQGVIGLETSSTRMNNVSTAVDITGLSSITFTAASDRLYRVMLTGLWSDDSGSGSEVVRMDITTGADALLHRASSHIALDSQGVNVVGVVHLTGISGSYTVKGRVSSPTGGSVDLAADSQSVELSVEDLGLAP